MQVGQQSNAVDAALRTQGMTMALYTGGLTNYLDVVVAQVAALNARIALVQTSTRAIDARVELIRALGGGWSRGQLPTGESVLMPSSPCSTAICVRHRPRAALQPCVTLPART